MTVLSQTTSNLEYCQLLYGYGYDIEYKCLKLLYVRIFPSLYPYKYVEVYGKNQNSLHFSFLKNFFAKTQLVCSGSSSLSKIFESDIFFILIS